jgi:hypothetical protein
MPQKYKHLSANIKNFLSVILFTTFPYGLQAKTDAYNPSIAIWKQYGELICQRYLHVKCKHGSCSEENADIKFVIDFKKSEFQYLQPKFVMPIKEKNYSPITNFRTREENTLMLGGVIVNLFTFDSPKSSVEAREFFAVSVQSADSPKSAQGLTVFSDYARCYARNP